MGYTDVTDEMETALLSVLFKHGYLVYDVIKSISPRMFSSIAHQNIFRAMLNLAERGTEPSTLLVKGELIKMKAFDASGGDEYLTELLMAGYKADGMHEYIKNIDISYKRRELVRLGSEIPLAIEKGNNPDTILSKVSVHVDNLIAARGMEDVVSLGDILDESLEAIYKRMENPGIQGITTSYSSIDNLTMGYNPTEMWFIGARPSMGKTAWLLKSLLEVAKNGNPVLLVNREMNLLSIPERLYSMVSGVPLLNIRSGRLTEDEKKLIKDVKGNLKELPFHIDNKWAGDDTYIFSVIRKYHHTKGVKVVGLDYIQLLIERDSESTHAIGRISRGLKLLSGELGLTSIVLSQLSREVEKRDNKRPIMSDLRQSGNMEEDADIMAGLYRDEVYKMNSPDMGIMEFIIRKSRNGPIGTCKLNFDGETVHVYDENDIQEFKFN